MSELSRRDSLAGNVDYNVDTETLTFVGLRGDPAKHLKRAALLEALAALPKPPTDEGTVNLLVARGDHGERVLPQSARLTVSLGLEGDRWARQDRYGPGYQLATTQTSFARVVANGQPLELHGDNLFLDLDLSRANLPAGSIVQLGGAITRVTDVAHNGCRKWVQRFGLDATQLNMMPEFQHLRLRGLYLVVVDPGVVAVGDRVVVLERGKH
jgi:hypothetical protein